MVCANNHRLTFQVGPNLSTAYDTANSSLSVAEYPHCALLSSLLQKLNGLHTPCWSCTRTAPTAMFDASHHISVWAVGDGCTSRVALAIAALMLLKATSCSGSHGFSKTFCRIMFFSLDSGAIFADACGTKRWKKAHTPRNRSNSFGVFGTGNCVIASTRSDGIEIPSALTTCPRNVRDALPSSHFFLFRRRPLSLSLWKRQRKSKRCCSLLTLQTIKSSM